MKRFSLRALGLVLPMVFLGFAGKAMAGDMIVKKAAITNFVEKKTVKADRKMFLGIWLSWKGYGCCCMGAGGDCEGIMGGIELNAQQTIPFPPGFNPPADALVAVFAQHDGIPFDGNPVEIEAGEQNFPAGDSRVEPVQPIGLRFPAQISIYSQEWGGQLLYYYED